MFIYLFILFPFLKLFSSILISITCSFLMTIYFETIARSKNKKTVFARLNRKHCSNTLFHHKTKTAIGKSTYITHTLEIIYYQNYTDYLDYPKTGMVFSVTGSKIDFLLVHPHFRWWGAFRSWGQTSWSSSEKWLRSKSLFTAYFC